MNRKGINWDEVDFSVPAKVLAIKYSVSTNTVHSSRKRRGIKGPGRCSKFSSVDWRMTNKEISLQTGATLHHVAQARIRYGNGIKAPRSPHRRGGGKRQRHQAMVSAKLSERKTIHQWLNLKGISSIESGKPICLLRRLSIALEIHP